jgi:hypothetical protein
MLAAVRLFDKLTTTRKESARIDFKSSLDLACKQDWCEILKDIAAMANTRGGVIVVGVNDDGTPSDADVSPVLRLDPAQLTDKISSYTGVQYSAFEIKEVEHFGHRVAAIFIRRAETPLVFIKPGTYPVVGEKQTQKNAFSQGTVYVRHGAKSEPATTEDLRKFIERRIEKVARTWRKNIRRVVTAPVGHEVLVVPPNMKVVPNADAQEVRLVNDPTAPASRFVNPDQTHPYRQKELIPEVRRRLDGKAKPNTHHILCVRRVHRTDKDPNFTYAPKYGSPQYSPAFADWIADQFRKDPDFFKKAYEEYSRQQSLARRKKKPR